MFKKRVVIYPKDVVYLTGRSERYAQILLHKVRVYVNKEPHQFVTISDFALFSGIPEEMIRNYMI
ncbi:hypothetical protein [Algoriphagus winogradskyi]|uniref:Uncharacterized protein n=1 Tax=Algoriphagus winogradskyi TaxID=237017 RepID=A0ABY1P4L4_9BACT|nr:hypothetical protein [Algoriphagus winogradskyi]SMP26271.1 hypothetical protein SAMN06265367_104346 [Algoriphagus winogradskyi]